MSGNLRSLSPFGSAQRLAARVALGLALAAGGLGIAQAQEVVGKVLMAIGRVEVQRDGKAIPAKKDTEIFAGDTITTGSTSNAQVRFKDGAVVAFRPETEFRVDEYKYSGKPDGTEKAAVSLVKGGVRAVTGAIGRSNRDNLKVNAVVATVGIRGTGFNITFCGASCKAANPNANEGLYAGVFEGKVSVSNQGGSTSELGVNRFAYVRDENTAPILLIAPPSFLKDSLEAQVRIRPKDLGVNAASENSASLQNANATVKAPATGGPTETISAEKVQKVPTPLTQIAVVNDFPSVFYETNVGGGTAGRPDPAAPTVTYKLRAAEYKPGTTSSSDSTDNQISLNRTVTAFAYGSKGYDITRMAVGGVADAYTIDNTYTVRGETYTATLKEGGTSQNTVAWGRWAGGSLRVGDYGKFDLTENQGWHFVVGQVATSFAGLSTVNMTLIGGTSPTELRDAASGGWRLTGGSLSVNFSALTLSGDLKHYFGDSAGYGNFNSTFSGTVSATPSAINTYTSETLRTSGNTPLCTSSCAGTVKMGFYGGGSNIHAGAVYQINTGANGTIQGVAVYK